MDMKEIRYAYPYKKGEDAMKNYLNGCDNLNKFVDSPHTDTYTGIMKRAKSK